MTERSVTPGYALGEEDAFQTACRGVGNVKAFSKPNRTAKRTDCNREDMDNGDDDHTM